jgi:hypothetical protein
MIYSHKIADYDIFYIFRGKPQYLDLLVSRTCSGAVRNTFGVYVHIRDAARVAINHPQFPNAIHWPQISDYDASFFRTFAYSCGFRTRVSLLEIS